MLFQNQKLLGSSSPSDNTLSEVTPLELLDQQLNDAYPAALTWLRTVYSVSKLEKLSVDSVEDRREARRANRQFRTYLREVYQLWHDATAAPVERLSLKKELLLLSCLRAEIKMAALITGYSNDKETAQDCLQSALKYANNLFGDAGEISDILNEWLEDLSV